MRYLLALALLLMPVCAHAETAYERVIRTGTLRCGFVAWPPFFIEPNSGKIIGFNVDVIDAMTKMIDLKVTYTEVVSGQQIQDLRSGRIDAVCGDAPWVLSSIKYLDYSQPYYYQGSYIYVREDSAIHDLNHKDITFIGIDADVSTDVVPRRFPKARLRTLPASADSAQLLTEIATGKADAVVLDPQSADRYIHNNPHKIRRYGDKPLAVQGGGFSVKKEDQALLNMLNEAVRAMINNGTLEGIISRYDPDHTQYLQISTPYR